MESVSYYEEKRRQKKEWLDSLQIGDTVAVRVRSWGTSVPRLHTVYGFTPKFIRLDDEKGRLFSKEDGRERNGNIYLEPVTEEVKEEIERYKLIRYFQTNFNPNSFTTEQLRTLFNAVNIMKIEEVRNNDGTES